MGLLCTKHSNPGHLLYSLNWRPTVKSLKFTFSLRFKSRSAFDCFLSVKDRGERVRRLPWILTPELGLIKLVGSWTLDQVLTINFYLLYQAYGCKERTKHKVIKQTRRRQMKNLTTVLTNKRNENVRIIALVGVNLSYAVNQSLCQQGRSMPVLKKWSESGMVILGSSIKSRSGKGKTIVVWCWILHVLPVDVLAPGCAFFSVGTSKESCLL